MNAAPDSMIARLRPLPWRLRIAHLAALLRVARAANARERSLSDPSRVVALRGEGSKTIRGGRAG